MALTPLPLAGRAPGRTVRLLASILAGVAAAGGCDPVPTEPFLPPFERCAEPTLPDAGAAVHDAAFWSGGVPLVPHGIDSYPLLEHVGAGELDAVAEIFAQASALGRPIVRTNAFMDVGDNPARIRDDSGELREEGLTALDRLVAAAHDAGIALLLVMTNNWEDYGGAAAVVAAVAPGEGLPKDSFWSEPRCLEAQRAYLQAIVSRSNTATGEPYAADATIFGWELANEARCDDPDWCADGTLPAWAAAMSAAIRDAGASQPIFWGGAGFLGAHGEDLGAIGRDGGVDVLTLHLYLHHEHPELFALPAAARIAEAIELGAELVASRADVAAEVGLPLVVEELGWKVASAADRDAERAAVYAGWLGAAHWEGLATMPWMIGESGRLDWDGLLIRPDDAATWAIISCEGDP